MGPYNKFMKSELVKVKEEHPTILHKDAFVMVAKRWKDAPENPKNQPKSDDKKRCLDYHHFVNVMKLFSRDYIIKFTFYINHVVTDIINF
ncbi:unnamed protein product [Rhizophagus irregularis]|nr:unnamed protein product [Rhizophagus irregularis]